jgi:hypothetical protein
MVNSPLFIDCLLIASTLALAIGFWAGRHFLFSANVGEALVAEVITSRFRRPHVLLNNVTIEAPGGTSQIDHVLVADTGIFVIETKHYGGWIYGSPGDSCWTQVIYKKKSKFNNPVHQNYGHVKALQALFNLPESNFISVVVFTNTAEFKTSVGSAVVKLDGLMDALSGSRPVIFDERKMAYIVGRIEMKRLRRSIETDEYHLNYVRQRLQAKAMGGRL